MGVLGSNKLNSEELIFILQVRFYKSTGIRGCFVHSAFKLFINDFVLEFTEFNFLRIGFMMSTQIRLSILNKSVENQFILWLAI